MSAVKTTFAHTAATVAILLGCAAPGAPRDGRGKAAFSALGSQPCATNTPPFLSGMTWCGGSTYRAVADRAGLMHPLTIPVSEDGRAGDPVFGAPVALEGAEDLEGIAFDPLRKTVWVADESGPRISEHDAETGRRLTDLEIPERLKLCRANLATEALAISPDGLTLWTANEETLQCDGPVADRHSGAAVRLFRFRRGGARSQWRFDGEWPYVTDAMAGDSCMGYHRSGVADLAVGEDGTLYALEIEFSKRVPPSFRTRIYAIDFGGAEESGRVESLAGAKIAPVKKTLAFESFSILEMFEGIAFGEPLPGGGRLAVLVSDGDDRLARSLRYLRKAGGGRQGAATPAE